jgi:hypothetical protein
MGAVGSMHGRKKIQTNLKSDHPDKRLLGTEGVDGMVWNGFNWLGI